MNEPDSPRLSDTASEDPGRLYGGGGNEYTGEIELAGGDEANVDDPSEKLKALWDSVEAARLELVPKKMEERVDRIPEGD